MLLSNLKLFLKTFNLMIPRAGTKDKKNYCFYLLNENDLFLDMYNYLDIPPNFVKYVYVPSMRKPYPYYMTSDYKKYALSQKLIPVKGMFGGDYTRLIGKNFYYDVTEYIRKVSSRKGFNSYAYGRSRDFMKNLLYASESIPKDYFEKVLLYTINLNKPFADKFIRKKIFPMTYMILKEERNPFDKILFFVYDDDMSYFQLLYDKDYPFNKSRFKSMIKAVKPTKKDEEEFENETVSDIVSKKSEVVKKLNDEQKDKIKDIVKNYYDNLSDEDKEKNKENKSEVIDKGNIDVSDDVVIKAVVYHSTGDINKTEEITNSIESTMSTEEKENYINDSINTVLAKENVKTISTNVFINDAKPEELNDNQNPAHLLKFRKISFDENINEDIVSIFKQLEQEPIPLKLKGIKRKVVASDASQINKTIVDKYLITLVDDNNKEQELIFEFPHLNDDGSFLVNGQKKILINQLVPYPIFFEKPYLGSLRSDYSVIQVMSKQLKTKNYLLITIASYKLPIMLIFGYLIGFKKTMDLFGIDYQVYNKKVTGSYRLPFNPTMLESTYKLNEDDKQDFYYLTFTPKDEAGDQLIESFNKSFTNINTIKGNDNIWRELIIKNVGNRNCIYIIDSILKNIITPTEEAILKSKGDPYDIVNVLYYMCTQVVNGVVDDRNDISKMRIRSSELFTSLLNKQIKLSYNQYLSKKRGGDDDAEMFIDPKKVMSAVKLSQNFSSFENINPLEELSMLTKITPVGIGGITKVEAFPGDARQTHPSYYGNIDPLDTPDSDKIGVVQNLSVGATLTNSRGMFAVKNNENVSASEILSTTACMIPFVESNDGNRVQMATQQAKQAFPLKYAEPPVVQTGFEGVLAGLLSDSFVKKSPVNGKIKSIDNNVITIIDEDGNEHNLDITPERLNSGQGKSGLNEFNPIVKEGDKVSKGSILCESASVRDGMISNGINVLCAFMPWKGFNFEDAMVVSESLVKRFTSVHVDTYEAFIKEDEEVVHIVNIGDELEKGNILISYGNVVGDIESYTHKRCNGGIISNIEIFSNLPRDIEFTEPFKSKYDAFVNKYKKINGRYTRGRFKKGRDTFEGTYVKFTVKQELQLTKGDKLNNRHFNKGVVAIIEPDENMPLLPDGRRVHMCYNPLSVINRMNSGQILELHTSMIAYELAQRMIKLKREKFFSIYFKILSKLDGTIDKKYSSNLIMAFKKMNDGQYNKAIQQAKKNGFIPLIFPPFKTPKREDVLDAMKLLNIETRYPLYLKEFNKTTKPVAVGYIYVMKLEHISEKKLHSRGTGPYVSKTLAPTKGKSQGGGGLIGEGDLYTLLGLGAESLVEEFFGPLSNDHVTKNEMISEIVYKGDTNTKEAKTNPTKDLFASYMRAIHLEMY